MSPATTTQTPLLDHGYALLVESWGSDEGIIEAARMSTAKGFKGWGGLTECTVCGVSDPSYAQGCNGWKGQAHTGTFPGDEKLLRYLYEHKHSTPFEMAGLTVEIKAPIFVFRQWHRHRTQSYNESSARYMPLPDENYIPTVERLLVSSKKNKQAGKIAGAQELTREGSEAFRSALAVQYARAEQLYQSALELGVPKELARVHLPVARYSSMRASANLRNWLAFLTLRSHSHAQYEIRVYANAIGEYIAREFPRTWELFCEGREA